ncbi:MAG: phosphoribosylaminoimidazolesuccinocarboxamide synthase [Planctomycetota bacterium]
MSQAPERDGTSDAASGGSSDGGWSDSGAPLFESDLTLPDRRRGKVRDIYRLAGEDGSADRVVMVASDRLSAFDVVLPTPIAGKGRVLTGLAAFWLRWIEDRGLCRTHLISTDAGDLPESAFGGSTSRADVRGRVTIGRACRVVPVECVVRGYLEGSGWKDYRASGEVCGVRLPAGMLQCGRIEPAIFTPATKAERGHDENIGFEAARAAADPVFGDGMMARLRDVSLAIYRAAAAHALERGIIIADTKFEFGVAIDSDDREAILIDEALTPDSSRFWAADGYQPGRAQRSYDKQFVREYLEALTQRGAWNKAAPGPVLPAEVVGGTIARYREAAERLMG